MRWIKILITRRSDMANRKFKCLCERDSDFELKGVKFLDISFAIYTLSELEEEPARRNYYYRNIYECRKCKTIYITPVKSYLKGMKLKLH